MNTDSCRGTEIASDTYKAENDISPEDQKRYKLSLLLRSAQRVAAFSPECEVCQRLQEQIVNLDIGLSATSTFTSKNLNRYLGIVKSIVRHLKQRHGLVEERQYVKRCVFMGVTLGLLLVLLGLIMFNFGMTILTLSITLPSLFTRIIFGYTIGYFLDRRARKQGKVI